MWRALKESRAITYASLFTSFGTLICCAIPSTLVLLGFGTGLASLLGHFPFLVWPSEHKGPVFGVSLSLLTLAYLGQRYAGAKSCPIQKKDACELSRSWSRPTLIVTFVINLIGALYAFVLPKFL